MDIYIWTNLVDISCFANEKASAFEYCKLVKNHCRTTIFSIIYFFQESRRRKQMSCAELKLKYAIALETQQLSGINECVTPIYESLFQLLKFFPCLKNKSIFLIKFQILNYIMKKCVKIHWFIIQSCFSKCYDACMIHTYLSRLEAQLPGKGSTHGWEARG